MIDSLVKRLNALSEQNEQLGAARGKYLLRESERKHFESNLVRAAVGKSHAEKLNAAQASDEWLVFHRDLAKLEALYEFEKLKFEILDKAFLAEHLSLKLDASEMKRQL